MDEEEDEINNYKEDYSKTQDIPLLDEFKKTVWIILFIGFFILLFLILFIALMNNSKTIVSKNEIIKGEEIRAKENSSIQLKFEKEKYNINVSIIEINSVDITLQNLPIKAHILINETYFFDINKDGKNDLRIRLIDIKSGKAILFIKRIDNEYCVENWQCGSWGECLDRIKNRKCIDLNECGRNISIPPQKIFCLEDSVNLSEFTGDGRLNCSNNNATICNSSEKCNGFFINSSDSLRCCFGECFPYQLNESIYLISCNKEISLFKVASYNCSFFTMNCQEQTLFPELGLVREINSTFKLIGYTNASCIFYYSYTNYSMNYSNEKFQELLEKGKTFEQINFEIDSLNKGSYSLYFGKNITCYYPQNELEGFLYKWETGKETWSLDILGKYECTGSLRED